MKERARPGVWLLIVASATSALTALAGPQRSPSRGGASTRHGSITQAMQCSACHTQTSWEVTGGSVASSGFDHSKTGFPLSGRHRAADCTDCHSAERAITSACSGCHDDAHNRTLGQACERCHSAVAWASVSGLAIHRPTRLPLTGRHVLAACSECHVRASDNQWRGVPADCYACHAGDYNRPDIHPLHRGVPGDPSKPALPKNCAACHRTTSFAPAFGPEQFQFRTTSAALTTRSHDASFPISFGKHRRAGCPDCHVSEDAPRVVICTGCHAHEPRVLAKQHRATGPVGGACLNCHPGGARR